MFLKEVSSAHQTCIYLNKNTEKTVMNPPLDLTSPRASLDRLLLVV